MQQTRDTRGILAKALTITPETQNGGGSRAGGRTESFFSAFRPRASVYVQLQWEGCIVRTDLHAFGKSFIVVGVTITASVLWLLPTYGEELGQTQQGLRGGKVIVGAAGIVDLNIGGGSCTGSLVSPNAVITAAHCLNGVGAVTSSTGNSNIVISYYDPATGRRQVFNGSAAWRVLPEYKRTPGNAGGSNSDIGLIFTANSDGNEVPTMAAIASGIEIFGGEGGNCTNNDWGVDDAFYSRTTWEKLGSMMAATGISCQRISSAQARSEDSALASSA
jgi:Trypsin